MTTNIEELRDRARTASVLALDYKTLTELIDRLEAAEAEALEEARLNGMGAERELALMAKLEAAEKSRDVLRAKVEAMEKQEPVALVKWQIGGQVVHLIGDVKPGDLLYALPGAQTQGEEE